MRADVAQSIAEALSSCCNLVILDDGALTHLLFEFKKHHIWNHEL
jgi:hypothetical protein